jgi:hypothetical protein
MESDEDDPNSSLSTEQEAQTTTVSPPTQATTMYASNRSNFQNRGKVIKYYRQVVRGKERRRILGHKLEALKGWTTGAKPSKEYESLHPL